MVKKLALIFVLTLSVTFTVFAEDDGHTHNGGGRNCSPEQSCLIGGSDGSADLKKEPVKENDFISELLSMLKQMFG